VQGVWFGSLLNYCVDRQSISTFDAWIDAVMNDTGMNKNDRSRVKTYCAYTCWVIWKMRCEFVYGGKKIDSQLAISRLN